MNWFELPIPQAPASAPAFATADAARTWLAGQPQAMPAKLQQALAEQLERLAASPLPAFTRATLLETLRNSIVISHQAVRRKYAFQPRPLTRDGLDAFRLSVRVWTALATGYLQCLEGMAAESAARGAGELDRLATAVHRALVACRKALEDHHVAGIEAPQPLWARLQRLIQVASVLGVQGVKVTDPEYRDLGSSTPAEQYILAALMTLADPYRLTGAAYAVAERGFMRWLGQASLATRNSEDPRLRWVPLTALAELAPAPGEGSPEWLEVHLVRRKLRKRIEALDAGESPEALQLGRELGSAACRELLVSLLEHLRAAYSEGRERMKPIDTDCEIAVGPAACFELLANRPFSDSQSMSATSARILHDRIALFGSSTRVEQVEATRTAEGERWRLIAESLDAAEISRPADASAACMLPGQLVVFRDARSTASLAVVTRAWTRDRGRFEITLRRLPGKPAALTANAIGQPTTQAAFPIFLLPEVTAVGSAASLLLPTGIAARLKTGIEARGETPLRVRLEKLLERGADFERYAYAPI